MKTTNTLSVLGCALALIAGSATAFAQTAMDDAEMAKLVAAAKAERQLMIYSARAPISSTVMLQASRKNTASTFRSYV